MNGTNKTRKHPKQPSRTRVSALHGALGQSSGNVFADLGLKDSDQLMARAQIGFYVFKILEDRKMKQRETAEVLGIAQPEVSHLMNGHFSRFKTDKLLDFLKRLDQKVTIQVSRRGHIRWVRQGRDRRRARFSQEL